MFVPSLNLNITTQPSFIGFLEKRLILSLIQNILPRLAWNTLLHYYS